MHVATIVGVFDTDGKNAIALHAQNDLKTAMDYVHSDAFTTDIVSPIVLKEFRKPAYHEQLIAVNLVFVKEQIAKSNTSDILIIQSINAIEELTKSSNTLVKRVREWYGYYFPELEHDIEDNEVFVKRILQKSKEEFMQEYGWTISMGPDMAPKEVDSMLAFARQVGDLFIERDRILAYLEDVMKTYCPNVLELTGAMIGAKLLEKAKSLHNLAFLSSSTIQLLGAEKALFRHLRNKKIRPPKHGFILSHQYVMGSRDKGKAARMLAAKISIAAKVDYFKGEYVADKLKEELGI